MTRLRHSQLEALSKALLEIHVPGVLESLPERFFNAVRRFLTCDIYCYNELRNDQAIRFVDEPEYRVSTDVFERYMHQHPSVTAIVGRQIQSPVKISDFASLRHWQSTDLYNEFFRSEGQKYQMAFMTPRGGSQIAIALNRATKDFSEEERRMLDIMQPHLVQAYENSRIFSFLSAGLEAQGAALLTADADGRIRFSTGAATSLISRYVGPIRDSMLPDQVRTWLKPHPHGTKFDRGLVWG